jgi:hypothetical protein
VKTSLLLFFISAKALAFLPSGKIENYNFKEQSTSWNYSISGEVGFVSRLDHIFSSEKATIIISNRTTNEIEKEIQCDEITYELNNSYIQCGQGTKYFSLNLKTLK